MNYILTINQVSWTAPTLIQSTAWFKRICVRFERNGFVRKGVCAPLRSDFAYKATWEDKQKRDSNIAFGVLLGLLNEDVNAKAGLQNGSIQLTMFS